MTRDEAVARLKEDIYRYADFSGNPNEDEFWQAFDMAIEALNSVTDSENDAVGTENDVIKRQDVIDELKDSPYCYNHWISIEGIIESIPSAEPPYQYSQAYVEQIRTERDFLQDMVNAEPRTDWIPVSERLPKESQYVIVTVNDGAIYTGNEYWTGTDFWAYGHNVTAWMPLPKPYKGGDTE